MAFLMKMKGLDMKLFLTKTESREVKKLMREEKSGMRKMTQEELEKIEHAEKLHAFQLTMAMSISALIISILSFSLELLA